MSIVPFTFPDTGQPVRTVTIDGEPWFVAADTCAVLGHSNSRVAVSRIPERMKGVTEADTPGGRQRVQIVSDSGVYRLVMRSNLPAAERFQDWLAEEVIPSIRRTGRYEAPPPLGDPLAALERQTQLTTQAIEIAKTERARADAAVERAAELAPEAARAKQTLDADGLSLIGTVAKRFGIKEKSLRAFLHAEGLLIRGGARHNEPMARYVASGHMAVKVRLVEPDPDRPAQARSTTFVTPKGEALIWRRLHSAGYVTTPAPPSRQLAILA